MDSTPLIWAIDLIILVANWGRILPNSSPYPISLHAAKPLYFGNMISAEVCLNIAIDHRIRQLLKPVPKPEVESYGDHTQKFQQLYSFLLSGEDDPVPNALVTEQLAKPHRQGGFLVALQRPADNHPFLKGIDVVVEGSPTLRALRDMFALISLDLATQVTVLDSLPFLQSADKTRMLRDDLKAYVSARENHHATFLEAVLAKRPDVVLCMWQREREPEGDWLGREIESLGVGRSFKDAKVTLGDRLGNRIETQRVNLFHPSYSMNWNPGYSRFRQLLMLEIAHACHLLRRDWQEEPWMTELRDGCIQTARQLAKGSKPELRVIYADAVTQIQDLIPDLASSLSSRDQRDEALYNKLITAKWTEHMNDAALCLQNAQKVQRDLVSIYDSTGPSADIAIRTMELVMCLAMKLSDSAKIELRSHQGNGFFSDKFVRTLRDSAGTTRDSWFRNHTLKNNIVNFLLGLNSTFSDEEHLEGIQSPFRLQMSLAGASEAFLTMAREMERFLSTLLGYRGEEEVTEAKIERDIGTDIAEVLGEAAIETKLFTTAVSGAMEKLERLKLS